MARIYTVSADTSEKEKVIGGLLTLAQGAWIALGLIVTATLFLVGVKIFPASLAIFLAIPPGAAVAFLFAFYRPNGLSFITYLLYRRNLSQKTKVLFNSLHSEEDIDIL